jgi:hypothetical protein
MIFMGYFRPFADEEINTSTVVAEVITLIYITLGRCYTDWVPNPTTRQQVGYAQISVVLLYISVIVV